jgi:hypothetical protein
MASNPDIIAANGVDDTAEFDAAFAEIASGNDSPANAAPDPENDDTDDGSDEPAPEGDTPPGDPDPAAADAPADSPTDDIWKDMPEPARVAYQQALRDFEHRERSLRGRLSASDRELNRLRQQAQQPAGQGQEQPREPQRETAADDLLASDEFKQFREDYAEIAAPIEGILKKMQDKLNASAGLVSEVQQTREVEAIAANTQALTERHADWQDCIKDERFYGWLETQPTAVREAAQRNWQGIVDVDDAALVFDRFKAQVRAQQPSAPSPSPQPSADPKRRRQLEAAKDAGVKAQPVSSEEPDDFDAAFANAAKKADQRRRVNATY